MDAYEKYVQIIEEWKSKGLKKQALHQAHHPYPEAFQKIKDEHKCDLGKLLEKQFSIIETVVVPDRVHFELHVLLVEMFKEGTQEHYKMSHALGWFLGRRKHRYDMTADEYELARTNRAKAISKMQTGKKHSLESRKKMSEKAMGKKMSPEARKKMSIAKKGKKLSDEAKKKLSEKNRGKKRTVEQRQHMREAQCKAEVKAKISNSLKGRQVSEETRKKIRMSNLGKKRSAEAREKMSVIQRKSETNIWRKIRMSGGNSPSAKKINCYTKDMIFVATYACCIDASKMSGVYYTNILRSCKGKRKTAGGFIWRFVEK